MLLSSVLQKALAQRKVLRKGYHYCFLHQLRRLLLPFSIALNALSSSACHQLGYCQCVCWIFHYLLKLSAIIWNRLVELVVVFFVFASLSVSNLDGSDCIPCSYKHFGI